MNNTSTRRRRRALSTRIILALVSLLIVSAGCAGPAASPVSIPAGTATPTPQPEPVRITEQMLEDTYGIHIYLVAVTAAGGMIDVRFRVLDKDQAAQLLDKPKPRLAIIAETDGSVIQAPGDTVQHFELETDQAYFVTFPNPQHVVESGSTVSLVIDTVRIEHVLVQ